MTMVPQNIYQLLEESGGCLWRIPTSLRLPILHQLATYGLDGLEHFFPQAFVKIYRQKVEYGETQDAVSVYVDWIAGHLTAGQRPDFDLSDLSLPIEAPRVLLVSPIYNLEESSIGLVRIAFFLRGLGIKADWRIATSECLDEIVNLCLETRYDIIGQGTTHYTFSKDLELVRRMAEKSPTSLFILGGHGAVLPSEQLSNLFAATAISIVARGFGERSTARLALGYARRLPADAVPRLEHIRGIYFRDVNGQVVETGVDRYNMQEYRALHAMFDASMCPVEEGVLRLITSTHCSFSCVFCSSRNFPEQPVTRLQADDVLHAIRQIRKKHSDITTIEFNDDNFSVGYRRRGRFCKGVDWLREFCKATQRSDLSGLTTCCFTRADTIDDETLDLLYRRLNLRKIGIGLEHVSIPVLRRMRKGIDADRVIACIRESVRLGIDTNFFIILFSKWEIPQSLLDLLEVSTKLCLEGAHVVYNWGFQPLVGADVSSDPTNRYISHRYKIGDYQYIYNAKIIPDDPFIGEWFEFMNTYSREYFDLQDELATNLLGRFKADTIDRESLWFKLVLRPHQNINLSNTLTNLIRFHSMFVFGQRFFDSSNLYFQKGADQTHSAVINYLYNGPTYPPNGVTSIQLKTAFLLRELPEELATDPLADLLAEIEVIRAGLCIPDLPGVHLGTEPHLEWARGNLVGWRARLEKDQIVGSEREAQQRIKLLLATIEALINEKPKATKALETTGSGGLNNVYRSS